MPIGEIFNFIQIDERTATAGQPSAEQFRALREAGYEVVINLAPDGVDTALPGQADLLGSLGIQYHHLPVAWDEPRLDQLGRFADLMAAAAGQRTLVHCQGNYRVTAFFALYAMANLGWTEREADALIARIWASRPGFAMDDTWQAFIAAGKKPAKEQSG